MRCVNMSNALVRSAQGLSLAEKRLVMLAVSQLDSKKPAIPENLVAKITAGEFAETFGVSKDTAYNELQSAGKQLFQRYISFYGESENVLHQMHWVGEAKYHKREGYIELHFWHRLAPHLFELKDMFTSYRLSRTAALRSIYSWRLFELLQQFKKTGWVRLSIDEFTHAMEAAPTMRNNFANLRIKVIEPAVKEICEKDGLAVTWEAEKAGRKVKALIFKFPVEQQAALPLPPVEINATPKPTKPKANKRLAKPITDKQTRTEHLRGLINLLE